MKAFMKKQQGASTVEFALMLPLLLFLIFVSTEFGIKFYRLNALTKSVQIAARYLSDKGNANTVAESPAAKNLAVCGSTTCTGITPILPSFTSSQITVSPNTPVGHVTVSASYTSDMILGGVLDSFMGMVTGGSAPSSMTLTASSVMRYTQ